jgi:YidC/Oxa1 family membrane protein insertase
MILVNFLRYTLEFFYSITDSYGLSIVLLSLAVTIIMLPLFWIAEVIQNKERARKAKMQPLLDEIKDVKNKQEKYYYTKEIYRKYQYSPLYALTGLIGLLIQVPFFLAAYWMLFEYLALKGVSYGPIKDLNQPDGLIALGNWTINLLPFVMTFVNLLAGYLYSKNMDKRDRIQLVCIAFVFLLLLYNLSAALVLYWTMNNIFAIGKNWLMTSVKLKNLEYFLSKHLSKLKNKRYIIYPLMFSTFPLLSIYFTNIGELRFSQIVPLLVIILFSTLIVLFIAKAVFKDKNKVVLFGVLIIILFFSYGHIRELFLSINIKILAKFRFLGVIYMFVFFVLSFFLFKTKRSLEKIAKVSNLLSLCLFLVIVTRIVYFRTTRNRIKPSTSFETQLKSNEELINNNDHYPDIYFLVLDGYANSKILKDKHNFDNSNFINSLEERDFYIAKDGRSNYMITFLSLAATLNMDYINYLKEDVGVDSKDRSLPSQMISDNKVEKYLKNKGYKTVNYRSGWGITDNMVNSDYNLSLNNNVLREFSTTFLQTTILAPFINIMAVKNYRDNVLFPFDNIYKIENIKEPKFVFAHVVSPHPPYLFDENGKSLSNDIKLNNNWAEVEKKYYLNQMKYVNKKIKALIDGILNKSSNAIIIIQSDHGSAFLGNKNWENPSDGFIQERGKILNAILFNNDGKRKMYPTISSVNTFRVVFNNVFKDNFELLNDSTYFSTYEKPYNFINVTEIINNYQ